MTPSDRIEVTPFQGEGRLQTCRACGGKTEWVVWFDGTRGRNRNYSTFCASCIEGMADNILIALHGDHE